MDNPLNIIGHSTGNVHRIVPNVDKCVRIDMVSSWYIFDKNRNRKETISDPINHIGNYA